MNCLKKLLSICILICIGSSCQPTLEKRLPNIVVVFTDDQGYGDLGSFGATDFSTSNLDKLATEGMRFTHFYAGQAVCSASRAALMTGCYPNRIGITGALFPWSKIGINAQETTIAEMLKPMGYATGAIGKWHLGHQEPFLPLQHGFDEYFGIPYSNDMWPVEFDGKAVDSTHRKFRYPPLPLIEGNETLEHITSLDHQDQLTTRYTEKAVDFIKRHQAEPFFLYLPHTMAHVPLGVSDKFRGKSKQGLYGDVIMEIDWSVGQIMATLDQLNLTENTLVIFVSDNGPWLNFGNHGGSTGGLREGKGTTYEGGQRIPCVMRWPSVIPAGTVNNQLASTMDLLPTLANLTGATLPTNRIDGLDITSLIKGNTTSSPRETLYYYYHQNDLEAVRHQQWKLVFPHVTTQSYRKVLPGNDGWPGPYNKDTTGLALYNLRRDPGEAYDVKALYPEKVDLLQKIAAEARKDLGDNLVGIKGENVRKSGAL